MNDDRFNWLAGWAARNGCQLTTNGEVGFGRPCAGILTNDAYVDYDYNDDDVIPDGVPDAYHKHPCLAVLHNGLPDGIDGALEQLFTWVTHLDAKGYRVVIEDRDPSEYHNPFSLLLHGTTRPVLRVQS